MLCQEALHRPATRAAALQAEGDEHRGDGAGRRQGRGHQAAQGPGRHPGLRAPRRQGEESHRGDGPHGAAHCAVKAEIRRN